MLKILTFLVLSSCYLAANDESWLTQVDTRVDQEAVHWLREKLKQDCTQSNQVDLSEITKESCKLCFSGDRYEMDPKIYVFMSFSIPDETWLKLSSEMEKYSGIFVIKGLPNNNFQELARRVIDLKMKGMSTEVQINPKLFKQFKIKEVPTFVFPNHAALLASREEGRDEFLKLTVYSGLSDCDRISGNISLSYALDVITKGLQQPQYDIYHQMLSSSNQNLPEKDLYKSCQVN